LLTTGALIIGLGEVGEITPEKVRSGVTEAALKYAPTLAEEPCKSQPETWRSAAMSVLPIGKKGGNALSVLASVSSITHGVLEANRVLREKKLWEQVRINALEFIEIYEDIAAEALRAARTLGSRLPAALVAQQGIDATSYLRVLEGGQFQRPTNHYATGWWRRILVTGERDKAGEPTGDLKFAVLTDRARAEETLSATQGRLTDKFVEGAIHSAAYNAEAASTLFQLLIPRTLREQASVREHLQFLQAIIAKPDGRKTKILTTPTPTLQNSGFPGAAAIPQARNIQVNSVICVWGMKK
jgi:hypothetical protein